MPKIFLSYRREDSRSITDRIYDRLTKNFVAKEVFKDVSSIPVGVDFLKYTNENISGAEVFLPIIGKTWASSLKKKEKEDDDYVRLEIEEALRQGLKIIPIFVEGAASPNPKDIPASIKDICRFNGINVRPDPDFEGDISKVVAAIKSSLSSSDIILKGEEEKKGLPKMGIIGIAAVAILGLLFWFFSGPSKISEVDTTPPETLEAVIEPLNCDDHKIGILVANFQEEGQDPFANTLAINLDNGLVDSVYDVRPVGFQSRNESRYNKYIEEQYYKNSCDTTGLFVNGFISKEAKVFNFYSTIINMELRQSEFVTDDAILFSNPNNIEFSIQNDAKVISTFILGLLNMYAGNEKKAIEAFSKLEVKKEGIKQDNEYLAQLAFMKAQCYAVRGDEVRALASYKKVEQLSKKSELVKASRANQVVAREVSLAYQSNPNGARARQRFMSEHKGIEQVMNEIVKGVEKVWNELFNKKRRK